MTWFAVLNGLALTVLSTSYLQHEPAPYSTPAAAFTVLALITQSLSLAFLPWPILASVALALPRRRLVTGLAALLYATLFLLVLLDTKVFALHRFHLNAMVWNLLTGGAAGDIFVISALDWLLSAGIVLGTFLGCAVLGLGLWRLVERRRHLRGLGVGTIAVVIVCITQSIHVWADATYYAPILSRVQLLPWPQGLLTAKRLLRRSGITAERTGPPDIRARGLLQYPRRPMQCADTPPEPNLLVIVVEGLRYDMASQAVMPNLHALGKTSWVFRNHFSGGNATRFGIFSIFYGVHGSYWHAFLKKSVGPVLVDEIDRHDYEIGLFTSASLSSPEFDRTVFVEVADHISPRPPDSAVHERDIQITKRFTSFVERRTGRTPFFGFLFYDSPHAYAYPAAFPAPFKPDLKTVSYIKLGPDSDPETFLNRYKNSQHFVDHLIGQVTDSLSRQGLLEKTIILVTGDHGQEFNETGQNYWGHNGNFSRYQTQVPLIVHWPGRPARESTHRTSHMDIVPTLMQDYFGCANPTGDYSHGRHLLDDSPRPYLTMSSWARSAILQDSTMLVIGNYAIEVRDLDYATQPDEKPDPDVLGSVMREMSQFLKR
jgi:membrane-anchored protein YejM (alkaline phosphatase superfamily)